MRLHQAQAIPYSLDAGEGEVFRWFGSTITVKASGASFDVALATEVSGSEPPLHVHADADEALFVIDGSLTVSAGGESFSMEAGTFVLVPRGVPHTYRVESGSARVLFVLGPAGTLPMYGEVERLFDDRGMPSEPRSDDFDRVAATLAAYGVTVVGPPPGGRDDAASTTQISFTS